MRISDWSSDVCSSDLVVTGFDTDAPVIGGSGGDVIDIAGLLDRDTDFTGITLAEAQNQGYVALLQTGDHTEIRVDVKGGGDSYSVLVADRKSVGSGKSVLVRVGAGGRRDIKDKKT